MPASSNRPKPSSCKTLINKTSTTSNAGRAKMAATTLLIKSPIFIPFNSIHPIPKSYHPPLISSYTKIPSNSIQFPRSFPRCRRPDMSRVGSVSDGGGGVGGGDGNFGGAGGAGGDGNDDNDSSSIFSWYLMALDKYPVATKAITSAFLTLVGDLICQLLIDKVTKLDLKRTFVFTFLGLVLVGPTLHIWYLSLSKMVTMPGASGTFLRLLLDQFVFSPLFIGVFLSSLVTLEGRPSEVVPKLQQEWFPSVLANWQLWIPFQFLNFQFVPQKFQVLAANFVALAWNVILSFKAHKEVVVK